MSTKISWLRIEIMFILGDITFNFTLLLILWRKYDIIHNKNYAEAFEATFIGGNSNSNIGTPENSNIGKYLLLIFIVSLENQISNDTIYRKKK